MTCDKIDLAEAKKKALHASRNACGESIEAKFYAKLIVDRYELGMRELGFEFESPRANTVTQENNNAYDPSRLHKQTGLTRGLFTSLGAGIGILMGVGLRLFRGGS